MDSKGREEILEKLKEFNPTIAPIEDGRDVRAVSIMVGNRYVTDKLLEKLKEVGLIYDPPVDPEPGGGPKLDYLFGFLTRRAFELRFIDKASTEAGPADGEE